MKISLVVATIGRIDQLARLLESLARQTWKDFECIIVDQNPHGTLDALLEDHNRRPKLHHLHHIHVDAKGVSAARNAGLSRVTGDIVGFPDDDCHYADDTLANIVEVFRNNPDISGIVGRRITTGEGPGAGHAALSPEPLTRFSAFRGSETYLLFFRRDVVRKVGGFDPALGPGTGLPFGCGEDTDYLLRAIANGFRTARAPGIHVWHPSVDPGSPEVATKAYAYGMGRARLLRKHRLPAWFIACNVAYPLARLSVEGPRAFAYRWNMFRGRLTGLLSSCGQDAT